MSALKTSQIHDGFATIRSRGLQRSRSRVEQLERLKPITMKCDSMPLYENPTEIKSCDENYSHINNNHHNNNNNNNNGNKNHNILTNGTSLIGDHQVVYKFESFTGAPDRSPVSDTLQNEAKMIKSVQDLKFNAAPAATCGTFKNTSNSRLSTSEASSSIEGNDRSSLPPPSPCYETYTNGFHSPKTPPESIRSSTVGDYFLYSRPTSPLYERYVNAALSSNGTNMSSSPDTNASNEVLYSSSPPTKLFTTSYYRKGNDVAGEYALHKIGGNKKPPLNFKTQSLQYRKSYSHPARTIYETTNVPQAKYDRGIRNYYNPLTNYYDPSEISYGGYTAHKQSAKSSEMLVPEYEEMPSLITKAPDSLPAPRITNGVGRRYATLAHPRDAQRLQNRQTHIEQQRKYASNDFSVGTNDVEYMDPLDFKIGCQTTLRSKPQIPWYELAIKKDNRRQSCPPMQVNKNATLLFVY